MYKKMTFKDLLKQDVSAVFLNPKEFGEKHTVNGKEMVIIIDNNEQIEREKRVGQSDGAVYANQKLFYAAASDFGALPKQGSKILLDGEVYLVDGAIAEGDIYSITISANRGQGKKQR